MTLLRWPTSIKAKTFENNANMKFYTTRKYHVKRLLKHHGKRLLKHHGKSLWNVTAKVCGNITAKVLTAEVNFTPEIVSEGRVLLCGNMDEFI